MLIMNNDENDLAFQTLSGIFSLTNILNELPLPIPCQHSLSSQSLLYEPRLSEEAHSWLSSEDATLVHSLTIAMASTNTDNIEFKDSCATDEVDHNAVPPLLKAIITHDEMAFKNKRGFSGIFKQPSYLSWDNNYDQQINFSNTAYELTDIMTPSPEESKSYINKDSTDNALEELHHSFPELKFSSDAMNITNKIPSNLDDITYNESVSVIKINKKLIISEKNTKEKTKKHKAVKHSKEESGQYSISKSNPNSQKLVLSLIKSPENYKKSKKKKKNKDKDPEKDIDHKNDKTDKKEKHHKRNKDHKKDKEHRKHKDYESSVDKNKEQYPIIAKSNDEPIKKIKLNIKLSNNRDNAQIISSTIPLKINSPVVHNTPVSNSVLAFEEKIPLHVRNTDINIVQNLELSPVSSKQCFTTTSIGFDTPSTMVDRISQCSTSSLVIPSSQEPDHHMLNYPVYSNNVDDQFDLSMPIDISGNNFSDFLNADDILSPLKLNMANNSMLNSVLRESAIEPFMLDDFENNMDMRHIVSEPGGLAIYLSTGTRDNNEPVSNQSTIKSVHSKEKSSNLKMRSKKNKRRRNEVEVLTTRFLGDKELVIEVTDIAMTNHESTWEKKLETYNQKYTDNAQKRKRNSRHISQNAAYVYEKDEDYPEASNNAADSDNCLDGSKRSSRKTALTYVGMDEGDDADGDQPRMKKRKKDDDDEPFEPKLKDPNDLKYTPLKKSQENIRKRRERVLDLTKFSNTNSKLRVPMDMLDPALITESSTYQHFISLIDSCFEDVEDLDLIQTMKERSESDISIPSQVLLSRENLQEMCTEIAKLKFTCSTKDVPIEKLTKLNTLLMLNISSGARICLNMPENDNDEVQNRNFRDYAIEKIGQSLDASFVAMNIMTSPDMHKEVFIEDVIESVVACVKYQLNNLIFPEYDSAYRALNTAKENQTSIKQRRAHEKESTKSKSVVYFYNRLVDIISNLSELVSIQTLTDTVILQLSSLGVSVFFVENINDIQLAALRLVTTIFSKYEKHRDLIIDDIIASLARLPSSKKNLRNYRLNSEDSIQMLTALTMLLVQSVVNTKEFENNDESNDSENLSPEKHSSHETTKVDKDSAIGVSYSKAKEISLKILSIFLLKSITKGEDSYKAIFENFVRDLLLTVNKPEWPAAELMLIALGSILTTQLINKHTDQNTKVIYIDYLGTVAATLLRDAVTMTTNEADIKSVIKNLITGCKSSDEEDDDYDDDEEGTEKDEEGRAVEGRNKRRNKDDKDKWLKDIDELQILRDAILDYLAADKFDPSAKYARQFYFGQWFTDSLKEIQSAKERQNSKDHKNYVENNNSKFSANTDIFQMAEDRRNHLLYKMFGTISPDSGKKSKSNSRLQKLRGTADQDSSKLGIQLKGSLDYEDACLVCRYIASLKPSSQRVDVYLSLMCRALNDTVVSVRTKAMKCLTAVVEADPSILSRQDIERTVNVKFHDHAAGVRDAAVDLVGKYILIQPQLIPQYYPMLSERILDKGISVRKTVIRIFREICIRHTEFSKIPEICVKMIRRINDEDAIKKLVNEVFQNMWFTPVKEKETVKLLQKVMNITDVVSACADIGFEWFDQLLETLLKKDDSDKIKVVEKACKQIVDCLVQNIMRLEEISNHSNQRLVSCLATLNLFTKIRPELMIHHAMTLQPYLNIKNTNNNDNLIIHYVAKILEVTVPLIEHPPESYINQIEVDMVKLIINGSRIVLEACVACLAATVNKISHNYVLVKECFKTMFDCLYNFQCEKEVHKYFKKRPVIARSLYTLGLLCKYFDFNNLQMENGIMDKVFEILIYFADDNTQNSDIRAKAMSGIGFLCIRYRELLTGPCLSQFYQKILTNKVENVSDGVYSDLVCGVLDNLSLFLNEEEEQMQRMNSSWNNNVKKESLKEMGDLSSGIGSQVAQVYLKDVYVNVLQPWSIVRAKAVNLIVIIIKQGLVNPHNSLPYLICAQTDTNPTTRIKADNEIAEINKRHEGFVNMRAVQGMQLSNQLHEILSMYENPEYQTNWCSNKNKSPPAIVRGVEDINVDVPISRNHNLYAMLRNNKMFRRSFLYSLLSVFKETKSRLSMLIYVSDNLAHFGYHTQEEPLYLVHNMDTMVSSQGPTIIQNIHEQLFPELKNRDSTDQSGFNKRTDTIMIEDEEDPYVLVQKMQQNPGALRAIREYVRGSRGCVLLVALKQYLRELYSLTDAKIERYSPSDTGKTWDKQLSRRSGITFDPISALNLNEESIVQENIYLRFASDDCQADINLDDELYPNESLILIHKFLCLRQLVIRLDRFDIIGDSEDDNLNPANRTKNNHKSDALSASDQSHRDLLSQDGTVNGLVSHMSNSHHSAVLQGQQLRVEVDKLDINTIPHMTHRRNTHKKTLVPTIIDISSDSDDHQHEKRSRLSIQPNRRSKQSFGNRHYKKQKPKYHNSRHKSLSDSQSRNSSSDDDSDPDFVG